MPSRTNIFMGVNKHILNYISCVKDLKSAISNSERFSTGEMSSQALRELGDFTLKCFCDGLLSQIRFHLPSSNLSLTDAYTKAKDRFKRLAERALEEVKRFDPLNGSVRQSAVSISLGTCTTSKFSPVTVSLIK